MLSLGQKLLLNLMMRKDSGCELATGKDIFVGLFEHTNGNPCDGCFYRTSCSFLKGRTIHDIINSLAEERATARKRIKTNAEIAEERGLTKRQVSKMRKRGEI